MGFRRFHTRRTWHNTKVMLWLVPFLVLAGVIIMAAGGYFVPLVLAITGSVVGLVVAIMRDLRKRFVYVLDGEQLHIERTSTIASIPLGNVVDVSLLDRAAAREYVRAATASLPPDQAKRRVHDFLQYCSVDIGITTYTLGLGRGVIDRMPDARHDLLLVRMHDGADLLLSPEYNQEMVMSIGRQKHGLSEQD
jgi:hypothetical protein